MRSWTSPVVPVLPATPDATWVGVRAHPAAPEAAGGPKRASLYVCGITPYDATHLGHAATYLTFDLLVRTWRDQGLTVRYTQNVTDVDDPLLERAAARGLDWRDLAARETDLYRADMEALRVIAPDDYLGAVETIPDVVRTVERLVADGYGYRVGPDAEGQGEGDIYADLSKDPRFGTDTGDLDRAANLARFAEMGGDPHRPGKRDALDPLLWRRERPGEPAWDGGDLGRGRPGWHIECATIAAMTIGAPFDVQGGGGDLRFPHHAMSISHLRALSTAQRPVGTNIHAGLVSYQGHKMSKSRGNLVLVSRLRQEGVDPMVIRLVVLAHPYAQDWEFHERELTEAAARLARWRSAVALPAGPDASGLLAEMRTALAAGLDAPRALAAVDAWVATALAAAGVRHDGATHPPQQATAPAVVRDAVDALLGVAL